MRIKSTTRVITAQSIITNWNKSLYVTIGTSSFQRLGSWHNRPIGSPGKYIILSRCAPDDAGIVYTFCKSVLGPLVRFTLYGSGMI